MRSMEPCAQPPAVLLGRSLVSLVPSSPRSAETEPPASVNAGLDSVAMEMETLGISQWSAFGGFGLETKKLRVRGLVMSAEMTANAGQPSSSTPWTQALKMRFNRKRKGASLSEEQTRMSATRMTQDSAQSRDEEEEDEEEEEEEEEEGPVVEVVSAHELHSHLDTSEGASSNSWGGGQGSMLSSSDYENPRSTPGTGASTRRRMSAARPQGPPRFGIIEAPPPPGGAS